MHRLAKTLAIASMLLAFGISAAAAQLRVVAAENVYGDVAAQIGGAEVVVTSILNNPNQDPHDFEVGAATARALSDADIIIYNGANYDPWMPALLAAAQNNDAHIIVVADLVRRTAGDNPHLWYDPATMPAVAAAIAAAFVAADPAHADAYAAHLGAFDDSFAAIGDAVAEIRAQFGGTPVAATEPVFGLMAMALGLDMREEAFQLAAMNDTEPRARDIAAFEADLRGHAVAVLFYNSQVSDDLTRHLLDVADGAGVPVVGVTETLPAGMTFQEWMLATLGATRAALAGD